MSATKIGVLKHGLKIGDAVHKSFEIREATTADLFAAEEVASSDKPITFNAALLCQQIVSIGEFTGPFTLGMLGKMKKVDLYAMQAARQALDSEGEAEQPV